ncbi:MAG: EpsG family protein [Lachnospiraceae bacterium]
MILYGAIAAVSVLLAYTIGDLDRKSGPLGSVSRAGYAQKALFLILFFVLFIPSALRQATGNDYMRYVEFFHLASVDAYVPTEPGFNAFVKLIYGLCGYENYLLVFALFALFTILLFLLAIRDEAGEDFGLAFFLFMMSGCYFQTYNTVRYYFALAAAVFSLRFFFRREYLWFVLTILAAASFHKSVLVVFLLYPMAAFAWKRWQLGLLAALGALVYATQSRWMALIVKLYPSYEDTAILAAGGSISWPNIARCLVLLLLSWYVFHLAGMSPRKLVGKERFWYQANLLALYLYVFASFVPELSRIAYYLVTTQIFLVPALLRRIPKDREKTRKALTALVILAAVLIFVWFLHRASDSTIRILPYRSFLFHDLPETPSRSIE